VNAVPSGMGICGLLGDRAAVVSGAARGIGRAAIVERIVR
jgi:hypothetical protein